MMEMRAVDPYPPQRQDAGLRAAAHSLEANFLAEMLKSADFGSSPTSFGGGIGEEQFTSFLIEEQAKLIVEAGGLGLSEQIFDALVRKNDAQ